MFPWAALKALPWKAIAGFALAVTLVVLAWHIETAFGERRYQAGRADVQAEVDRLTAKANNEARATEQAHQEHVHALDAKYQSQLAETQAALDAVNAQLADAHAVGERLRSTVRAITALHASTSGDATGGSDAATQTLGQLLESCSGIAEQNSAVAVQLAGQAEQLAEQLRSLQSYATEVSPE